MNLQGLELLPDDALRHATAEVLHQQTRTAILREREGVEIGRSKRERWYLYGSQPDSGLVGPMLRQVVGGGRLRVQK
jgi:hypothetical protein